MPKYKVTDSFFHKNRFLEVGETVEMTEKAARYLSQALTPISEPAAEPVAPVAPEPVLEEKTNIAEIVTVVAKTKKRNADA